jgi:hypothetical protein
LATETIKMLGTKFPFYVSYVNDGLITVRQGREEKRVKGWRNAAVIKKVTNEESLDKIYEEM